LDAEPPRIVLEHSERCADGERAAERLQQTLAPARAPGPGWVVTMRIDSVRATVEGEITDRAGAPVGRRALPKRSAECSGAARALGVWATLVLDAERQRVEKEPSPAAPLADSTPSPARALALAGGTVTAPPPPVDGAPWPAPEPTEKPPPEADWYLHHEDERSFELGASTFLLAGTVGGTLLGGTVFAVVEAGRGIFLRPSLALGKTITSIPSSGPESTWAASRIDACLRLPGFYAHRQGIQLEGCGGGDLGFSFLQNASSQTIPYVALGPSIDLRGELGHELAVLLRGVFGVNVVRATYTDDSGNQVQSSLWSGRLELAFSWSLR
jgi:hypothetical protein